MFWLPGQNTTIGMPTPLNGHRRIRRCVDGSLNMPPEFSAGFHAGDTRALFDGLRNRGQRVFPKERAM